jgi:hypothetical protein
MLCRPRPEKTVGITYRFDIENALVRLEVVDPLDGDEIRRAAEALLADPRLRPGVDVLSDHSRLASPATREMVEGVIPLLTRFGERLGRLRCALVVASDASYGMGRMMGLLAGSGPVEVVPFRNAEEAEAWLRRGPPLG